MKALTVTMLILLGVGLQLGCGTAPPTEPEIAEPAVTVEPPDIVGTWVNAITVAPDPPVTNVITFSGGPDSGTFMDQFEHSGAWKLEGSTLTWVYTGVGDLENTFTGTVDPGGLTMTGRNFGAWQGAQFEGTWTATKKAAP